MIGEINWLAVIIGVVGFVIAYFFDLVSLKRLRTGKQAIGFLFVALEGYALFLACWGASRFWLPFGLIAFGWLLLPLSLALFIYSLFIEIPFIKTYHNAGVGDQLVRMGTYALVRHPGVIWYALFLLSLLFITRSITLLVAAPVWLLMDVLYVVIQERFFFSKMFPEYDEYCRQTPMLIPTRRSISQCLKTLKKGETI
jgi:protein-S-isoprenylcysteine O-methyltransferase Ste14